ncbi:hypothetical protein DS901_04315 [Loktanella sp. D2R18]|uniref:HlyU family transcriptional regulator n=1 Tax=Rhodobacterales TaxID=204455 RepID=UPI000DE840EB|nr:MULTISPECIES: HlyU family transcriptional regulator [Rhodobacterales]MDO6589118.1 HlyU family transcriptional regulator [Yoonia sp. 1_MG-2023]RBW45448.1 hypothetical protein DS901_04315 [Loktanella sp. D2R18]
MSLFKRLFGGNAAPAVIPSEDYNGYTITPEPIREGGKFRLAARIEKEIDGEVKLHHLIRADLLESEDVACKESAAKARVVIDQQGDSIFR